MCDNCSSKAESEDTKAESEATTELEISPFADALKNILAQAGRADCKLTGLKLVNSLMGKGETKWRCAKWSPPKDFNKPTAELIVANLLLKSFLKEDFSFTPYNTISYLVAGPLIDSTLFRGDTVEVPRRLCGKPSKPAQRKQAKKRRPDTDDDDDFDEPAPISKKSAPISKKSAPISKKSAPISKKSINAECISID